jgi:Glycosyl hydrolase family 67 N-terminus
MKRDLSSLCLALVCLLCAPWCRAATASPRVDVVVGDTAPELERFAASELCDYLAKLYGMPAHPARTFSPSSEMIFLIGNPETNATVREATAGKAFPKLTDQGIVLRRTELQGRPALIVGGGSPQATLWAVYELVERWGVRYLVDRDVLPERSEFKVPDLDVVMEPIFRVRAHPSIQDYAPSGESWGMADFRPLIGQLAKMKFNRLNVLAFGYQPYLDWQLKGIKRSSAHLWYDYHYPITPDMIGRQLFDNRPEFWNPDLPFNASYKEFVAAGEREMHNLIDYAHQRGMETAVYAPTTDFLPEFAPLLKGAVKSGQLTVRPGPDTPANDPELFELSTAVLRATLNTYPEADYVTLVMPEETQWLGDYPRAWAALDAKYGISKTRSLNDVLTMAANRKGSVRWPGERGLNQAKADIMALDYYDRLLHSPDLLKGTLRPDRKFIYAEPAEELYPLLDRVLPAGWEVSAMPENQPEHFLPRAEILDTLPTSRNPGVMDMTLDDDVVGIVPQIRPTVLEKFLKELHRRNWSGFTARERFPGDHDAILAYLGRVAWDANVTPDSVTLDLLRHVCGEECAQEMLTAFHEAESATLNVATNKTDFGYYIPKMIMKFWKAGPTPGYLVELEAQYERALAAARRAQEKATPEGRWYTDYWVGRLEFALGYARTVAAVQRAATAEAAHNSLECRKETEKALQMLTQSTEAYVRVARTRTDTGAIAVLNEYGIRPLKAKLADETK